MAHLPFMLLASTAISATGNVLGGLQQAQAANFNRRQALAEADARRAEAAREAELSTEAARRVFGEGEAAAGASGFTLGGSAADVLGDLAGQQSYNTRAILHQGAIERAALLDEAAAQKRAGRMAIFNGALGAAGSVLGGLAKAGGGAGALSREPMIGGDAGTRAAAIARNTKNTARLAAKLPVKAA